MSLGWFDSWNKNFRKSRDTSNLIGMENWGFRQIYCTVIQICWGEGSTPNLSCGLLPYCTVSPAAASSQDHYCMSASRFTFRNTKKVTSGYTLQYTLYNNTLVKYWPKESVCGQHIKKKTIVYCIVKANNAAVEYYMQTCSTKNTKNWRYSYCIV